MYRILFRSSVPRLLSAECFEIFKLPMRYIIMSHFVYWLSRTHTHLATLVCSLHNKSVETTHNLLTHRHHLRLLHFWPWASPRTLSSAIHPLPRILIPHRMKASKTKTYIHSTGMVKTLTLIYRENGVVKGLYRGMSINYIRAIPMVATSFSTYELMKQLLQMDTGMKVT